MKGKKLLIIGAGNNQVSLIKKAKEMGAWVIVVSPYQTDPGVALADEYFSCDIFSKDVIVEYARKKEVSGVLTDLSDICTPIAAVVAEKLGLPGFGYQNALCFTNKYKMREVFQKLGLPVAKNEQTKNLKQAQLASMKIGYPVVIKPTDSFSSRGVYIIHNEDDLKLRYSESLKCSKSKTVIVEKYISGEQYFSQGYVENGKLRLFAFSDRYYYNVPDICVPYTNAFPARIDDERKNMMTAMFEKIIDYLKPKFGQVWAEWILDDATGKLYIIEMAIRGAGAEVTTRVIPNAYGVDTQRYLIADAMGEPHSSFFDANFDNKASAFYSFLLPEGEIKSIEGFDGVESIEGVDFVTLKKIEVGDRIPKYTDKTSRYGLIVLKGENRNVLDDMWRQLKERLHVKIMTRDGLKDIIWE